MSIHEQGKLNQLLKSMPGGAVVTSPRLNELGVSPQLVRKYVQSGWLSRVGSGAFVRSGDDLDWLGGIYALQSQLGMTVHVAAVSALELQGRAHFIPLGEGRRVTLVSDRKEVLPKWFAAYSWKVSFRHRCLTLFSKPTHQATSKLSVGAFSVQVSSPEQAILEEMHMASGNRAIEHTLMLMEGLSLLRPDLVQSLLENCSSIKAKRLFLWAAERSQHTWFQRLDHTKIELGKGKRQLFKGGRLHPKYMITVPPEEELPDV
jgi:hypothetical protein